MKKSFIILFIFTIVSISKTVSAQGNLQFNQVILYDVASAGIQAISIPVGKVWKIESVGNAASSSQSFNLRNSAVQTIAYLGNPGSTAMMPLPFWLPAGFVGSIQNVSSQRGIMSIIEFNVVP